MTAHVLESDRENCFEVGMNDVVTKPIMRDQLHDILSRWGSN